MTVARGVLQYRRLQAPQDHGGYLVDPPASDAAALVAGNQSRHENADCDLQGRSLQSLAKQARRSLLQSASDYMSTYLIVPQFQADLPIIIAGHQPDLYHPGVWFKNFLMAKFARQSGAQAVHLLIDNDLVKHSSIAVPVGEVRSPKRELIAYDRALAIPHEDRAIQDQELFESFADRVQSRLPGFLAEENTPILPALWNDACAALARTEKLGDCLAQARHRCEHRWGISNLEVPLSRICDSDAFFWFCNYITSHLARFHRIYNDSISDYRQTRHIRSRTHPVPELKSDGAWLESPFWLWRRESPERRALFVRDAGRQLEFSNRADVSFFLESGDEDDAEWAVEHLAKLAGQGVRLRPRALLTTMFSRLFLSDLFIHGIGGAKYDQLTDLIIKRFFGIDPPAFVVATATAKLPIEREEFDSTELGRVARELRDIRFHGERLAISIPAAQSLIAEKKQLISSPPTRHDAREWHLAITGVNERLGLLLADKTRDLQSRQVRLRELAHHEKLLGSREFSFALFSEPTLRALLLDI